MCYSHSFTHSLISSHNTIEGEDLWYKVIAGVSLMHCMNNRWTTSPYKMTGLGVMQSHPLRRTFFIQEKRTIFTYYLLVPLADYLALVPLSWMGGRKAGEHQGMSTLADMAEEHLEECDSSNSQKYFNCITRFYLLSSLLSCVAQYSS